MSSVTDPMLDPTAPGDLSADPAVRAAARGQASRLPLTGIALAIFAVMAVLGVWLRPAMPIDETRYLTVAWEMRLHHSWIVPHLNGEIYGDKPPLLFWLINLVWAVTGPSEFAGRLVAPAFGLGAIWVTSRLGRALYPTRPELGGYAALALAGMGGFAFFAGLTMFDAMLTLATALGVLALVHAARTPAEAPRSWLPWAGYGAAIALGVISKGPVILVHLVPVGLALPFWGGMPLKAAFKGVGLGVLIALGLVLLWLVPALLLGGADYRQEILWTQSAGRVVSSFAHQKPWWFFVPLLPLLAFPWIWSLGFWKNLRLIGPMPVWIVATVAIFSLISGKQTHYLVPMLPAVALIAAPAIAQGARAPLAALGPLAAALYLLGVAFGLVKGEVREVIGPAWLLVAIAVGLVLVAAVAVLRRGGWLAVLSPAVVVLLSLLFIGKAGDAYDATLIGRQLAAYEQAGLATMDDGYAGEFGFAGRLAQPVAMLPDPVAAAAWLAEKPGRALMGRMDRPQPQAAPDQLLSFRGRSYGLWLNKESSTTSGASLGAGASEGTTQNSQTEAVQ
ncbi:ArnT family glycosyltransferase [Paracoccus aminophilus]|uniref:Glycosyltransferase n=1 Tax=Paracoccus aminophilus JCM 7686 TaxID=1367847 RepID=S5YFN2_PARAH|nr:glycosyltransferase family 39 protein [Paracoccus aminophilus]AGT10293.1 glycosyltransferase [Paracoccus aminophilus JCM 7686]